MKYILTLVIFLCSHVQAEDVGSVLQSAFDNVTNENWAESKKLLDSYEAKSAEYYLVSSLWHGAEGNPGYDRNRSVQSLETSYSLGSRDAQLMLVGVYLFSKEYPYGNYHRGMEIASDLITYYQNEITLGKDTSGELRRIIGKFYLLGIGMEKDSVKGTYLIKKAAKLGDIEAKEMFNE